VLSQAGGCIKAREALVHATNTPINNNRSVERACWWSTEDPYHYVRIHHHKGHDVLLVGGSDHTTGRPTPEYYDAWAELEAFARKRWPQCKEVVGRWSGQVYEPVDDLGLYGLDLLNPLNLEAAGAHPYC
ncbi:rieske domain-containing protein, partial [Haematococcus lacustris]